MTNIGKNIAKIRGMRRLTQKEMAAKLVLAQPEYSKIEQKAEIDDDLLERIAIVLEVSPEAIKNFNEDSAINIISNILNDHAAMINNYPIFNFNPIDKLIEIVDENRKLYEQLLKEKDNVISLLNQQKPS